MISILLVVLKVNTRTKKLFPASFLYHINFNINFLNWLKKEMILRSCGMSLKSIVIIKQVFILSSKTTFFVQNFWTYWDQMTIVYSGQCWDQGWYMTVVFHSNWFYVFLSVRFYHLTKEFSFRISFGVQFIFMPHSWSFCLCVCCSFIRFFSLSRF